MKQLRQGILEMIKDEEKGAYEYLDLVDMLANMGYPENVTDKILKMAKDEFKHKKTLLDILRKQL